MLELTKQKALLLDLRELTEKRADSFVFSKTQDTNVPPAQVLSNLFDQWLGQLGDAPSMARLLNSDDISTAEWYQEMLAYPPSQAASRSHGNS